MEVICKGCGFVNPECSQFCTLCGIPFLSESGVFTPSEARAPAKRVGDGEEVDCDEVLALTRSRIRHARGGDPADESEESDELDSLLSDFDGTFPTTPAGKPKPPSR